jgi:PAS domain S-box-containing protein
MMFQTSVIRPLQTLYKGMEQVDRGDLRVTVTPQFNDEIGAVTLFFNRMLQSIQEAEANFRTLAENAQDGILIVRQDGRIAYANRSVEWISGHSLSDLIDRPIQEVVRLNKGSADSDRFWASVSRQTEAKHLECHVMSKGKVLRPVEMTISNTYWHRIPALVVVLRDISERVLREEKERRHQQIMIQADKLTTLGILATAVAHDINNPTQVILTTIRILLRAWNEVHPNLTNNIAGKEQIEIAGFEMNELLDNITGWLADIESNSQRINDYVQSLRSYIRGQPSTMASVNLSTVVRSAVELMSYHIRRASDRFILRLDDTIPSIRGNPQQLEQVVINLIMNACQSLQDRDAEVEVSTSHNRNSGSVVLTIRDGGCGIPEENMERIMEPFFTTRTETGGTGMGLYIVDSIVKEHRGELSITSSIGRGTTVGVTFPQEDRI